MKLRNIIEEIENPYQIGVDIAKKGYDENFLDNLVHNRLPPEKIIRFVGTSKLLMQDAMKILSGYYSAIKEGKKHKITVAIDLDGTLAKEYDKYDKNKIGEPIYNAKTILDKVKELDVIIIINTCRNNVKLISDWLKEHKIPYDYINKNPNQPKDSSNKIMADRYWDNRQPSWKGLQYAYEELKRFCSRFINEERLLGRAIVYNNRSKNRENKMFDIYVDPGREEVEFLIKSQKRGTGREGSGLRAIITKDKVYVWESFYATHREVVIQLDNYHDIKVYPHMKDTLHVYINESAGDIVVFVKRIDTNNLINNPIMKEWGFELDLWNWGSLAE